MPEFHAPYNFIPVTGKVGGKDTPKTPWAKLTVTEAGSIRHDYWPAGLNSGRIVCRLTLLTPTVVGCGRCDDGNVAKLVEPYRVGGKLAIPASSLRGMIGAVAEALSQSALRVLSDKVMSVRKPMNSAISAIGLLKRKQAGDPLVLMPFTTGPIRSNRTHQFILDYKWAQVFAGRTWRNILPVYLDGYHYDHAAEQLSKVGGSFLDRAGLETFRGQKNQYYYARLAGPNLSVTNALDLHDTALMATLKIKTGNANFLLGQRLAANCPVPISQGEFDLLPQAEKVNYTKGVLFVLGIDGRAANMPRTKKHEYFLPLPSPSSSLPIEDAAIETYRRLNKAVIERKGEVYAPQAYGDSELASGRLIRFDVASAGNAVRELSWSAIWRQPVDGTVHDFFRQISSDLLPWSSKRERLTPAEALFGMVGAGKHVREDGSEEKVSRNLASRLRFSDARTLPTDEAKQSGEVVTLKILGSPKLPSAAMYFAPRNAGVQPTTKPALATDVPRGRKIYLPHPPEQTATQFWKTTNPADADSAAQKQRVQPLEPGPSFWFHIDFDNLSEAELKLVLTSLSPSDEFVHRLGLGKPLGLGAVRVEMVRCCLIDRLARYRDFSLMQNRYQSAIVGKVGAPPVEIYPVEAATPAAGREPTDQSLIDEHTLRVLGTVGNPAKLKPGKPVCYPFADGQQGDETEGFKWFVNNDDLHNNHRQVLGEVVADQTLPVLRTNHGH